MNLQDYKHIYMIGIGGISMSGLAEILNHWNFQVSGSDNTTSVQTEMLKNNGITVHLGQKKENITKDIDLVVYTAAIKEDNPELVEARALHIPTMERGNFLGELTKLFPNTIGIAGTHGKTTTTSMVASIFLDANLNPTIQVGAFFDKIKANYYVGGKEYFIIEACEYCDSYLNFHQKSAIVLNIDDDHLDYFKNMENIERSFQKYVSLLPKDGYLILNGEDERCFKLKDYTKAKVITIGSNASFDYSYQNVSFNQDGQPTFDVYSHGIKDTSITLGVTGIHNVLNSLCAIALCRAYDISYDIIKTSLNEFHGASRRLEFLGTLKKTRVFDDYGHHPTEILATINGLKNMHYHESWVIFEPHTYSRLHDHLKEFALALKLFDHVIVIDIYAAREQNNYDIHEEDLVKLLDGKGIYLSCYEDILDYLIQNIGDEDIILTLGAGNVTKIGHKLVKEDLN